LNVLLALDTATNMSGIALHDGQRVLAEYVWHSVAHHTVELAPEVALALRRNKLDAEALTALAVAAGPGSYTGLRIGMALAKGLSLTHKLPLVGIPTLDILARAQPSRKEPMLALLQAGRKRFAGVRYKWTRGAWRAKDEGGTFTWEDLLKRCLEPLYICGELTASQREALEEEEKVTLAPPALCVRRPSVLADMAWERIRAGKVEEAASISPTYLGTLSTPTEAGTGGKPA
jgi:tRNA threonylcarbamoyladenosine biosynthesis protein TsaB